MKISLMCVCLLDQYLPSLFVQVFESNNICIIEGLKHNYHKPQTFNPNPTVCQFSEIHHYQQNNFNFDDCHFRTKCFQ